MINLNYKNLIILLLILGISSCSSSNEKKGILSFIPLNSGLYTSNDWQKALLDAINDDPDLIENHTKLAQYFYETGNYTKAKNYGLSGLKLDENDFQTLLILSKINQKQGLFDEGIQFAEKAVKSGNKSFELDLILAELYIEKGKFSSAKYYLNEILKVQPNHKQSFYFKGLIALSEGDSSKAIANLETYVQSAPQQVNPYDLLSKIYMNRGKWDQSIKYAKLGFKMDSSAALALVLAKNYLKSVALDSSWKYLTISIKDSNYAEALGFAGERFYINKKYGQAIQCFRKEEILSNEFEHALWLAESYAFSGRIDEAKEYYQEIIRSDSTNIGAIKALERLNGRGNYNRGNKIDPKEYLPDEIVAPSLEDSI